MRLQAGTRWRAAQWRTVRAGGRAAPRGGGLRRLNEVTDRQTEEFARGEGDEYFGRNRGTAFNLDADPLGRMIAAARIHPASVAEIGASRGDRVAALVQRYGSVGVAVDPSRTAVEEGRRAHPEVEFHVGTMDAVPVDRAFDLVLVNFVFHWVGRADLLRSVAEVDRLVVDGGHLGIGDFSPPGPAKNPYHHREGLWTYKQDYPGVFVASGLYCPVLSMNGRYHGETPSGDVAPDDRAGFALLHKSLSGHYVDLGSP